MYRTTIVSAILAVSALTTATATADDKDGIYVTIGATLLSSELDLTDLDLTNQNFGGQTVDLGVLDLGTEDADIFMINGRIGYRFNDYFAVEGEVGFGTGGDDINRVIPVEVAPFGTVNVDATATLDVDAYYIGFARGILPVSDEFDLFVRVGYGEANAGADFTFSALGLTGSTSISDNESGFAYGVGGQYNFTEKDGIRADYTLLDDTDIISLAYSRRF